MTFFKNFKAQNNLQVLLYLVGAEIFGFRLNWARGGRLLTIVGTPHLLLNIVYYENMRLSKKNITI